jgi:hypothetical protein
MRNCIVIISTLAGRAVLVIQKACPPLLLIMSLSNMCAAEVRPLCTAKVAGESMCLYWAKREQTRVYDEPSVTSRIIFTKEWVNGFGVSLSKLKTLPEGWLEVEGEYFPQRNGPRKKYRGWVASNSVVSESDLQVVVGCWPFRKVEYAGGDYFASLTMKSDGSFDARYSRDRHNTKTVSGNVYYRDGILVFYAGAERLLVLGFDAVSGRLFDPYDGTRATRFPVNSASGCRIEPTTKQ